MGSVYAGLLASAGNEVLVVDRWAAHVEAINARGLRIEGASGERTVAVSAHTAPPDDEAEMIVIAAKAADLAGAAAAASRTTGESSVVRSEEHTSELQSLMRISYAVFRFDNTNH